MSNLWMKPIGITMRTFDILHRKSIKCQKRLDYGGRSNFVDEAAGYLVRTGNIELIQ